MRTCDQLPVCILAGVRDRLELLCASGCSEYPLTVCALLLLLQCSAEEDKHTAAERIRMHLSNSDQAKFQFVTSGGVELLQPLLATDSKLTGHAAAIFLAVAAEGAHLPLLLSRCSNSGWFEMCRQALCSELQAAHESMAVVLQKMSRETHLLPRLQDAKMGKTLVQILDNTTSSFLIINIKSILKNIGFNQTSRQALQPR